MTTSPAQLASPTPGNTTTANLTLALERWSAWAPGRSCRAAWLSWASGGDDRESDAAPGLGFLAPNLRRRLSRLSRMAMAAAFRACPPEELASVMPVFASRHGEIETTITLLNNIADDEPFSPTAFSHSVHNTAAGYFSIATGNRQPSISLAAGRETFCFGLIEAAGLLARHPQRKVLYVWSAEPLADIYLEFADEPQVSCAVAMLLSAAGDTAIDLSLTSAQRSPGYLTEPYALTFVRWLLSAEPRLELNDSQRTWTFRSRADFRSRACFEGDE